MVSYCIIPFNRELFDESIWEWGTDQEECVCSKDKVQCRRSEAELDL